MRRCPNNVKVRSSATKTQPIFAKGTLADLDGLQRSSALDGTTGRFLLGVPSCVGQSAIYGELHKDDSLRQQRLHDGTPAR